MGAVLRAAVTFLFLLCLFRFPGKRSLAEVSTFDLVLLLIVSEATQQGLLRQARSSQGLERMDQIKYAVLEPDGQISSIPEQTR